MFNIPMNTKPPTSLAEMVGSSLMSSTQTATQPSAPTVPTPATRSSYGGVHLRKGQKTTLVSANGSTLDKIKAGLRRPLKKSFYTKRCHDMLYAIFEIYTRYSGKILYSTTFSVSSV